ncbi:MAG: efflux RND transporter periplasmic adaptor subunit [Pseudomonadota bacterium]
MKLNLKYFSILIFGIILGMLIFKLFFINTTTVNHRDHGTSTEETSIHNHETLYTCGMHPEVVQNEPGTCPICGMDLVPMKNNNKSAEEAKEKKIKHWVAPMDPTYISDNPGKSPMGMDLVPVYENNAGTNDTNIIKIDPRVVQNMGIRTTLVKKGNLSKNIRTIGEVEVAEDEISVVNLRYSGWIEKLYVEETGQKVNKGDQLFEIYSPELVSAQEEYLLALKSAGKDSELYKASKKRLRYWELPDSFLLKIETKKQTFRTVTIKAPSSGYVLHKNIVQGTKVQAGSDLYKIGNLKKIWVNTHIYEHDAPWIELGQNATMELSFQKGKFWEGKVSYIYPTLNMKSRTVKVRLEFPNTGIALKPGMFATVRIKAINKENVLYIPTEAIINTGERQIVFLSENEGKFNYSEVITGLTANNNTEILEGLHEGDIIVTSGQFLLDSESQLQEAVSKLLSERKKQ